MSSKIVFSLFVFSLRNKIVFLLGNKFEDIFVLFCFFWEVGKGEITPYLRGHRTKKKQTFLLLEMIKGDRIFFLEVSKICTFLLLIIND